MRMVIAVMTGLLVTGLVAPVSGEAHERQGYYKKKKLKHYRYARPRNEDSSSRSDYYEHLADKLPVGSSRWFEQMEREGRFGRREN